MKDKLIADLEKLKESTKIDGFLYKRYTTWINIIQKGKPSNPELVKFLYSKSSHTPDKEYSLFLIKLAES